MVVEVDPDSTRSELVQALIYLNNAAKSESRRGYAGTRGRRYHDLHANINVIITELEMRDRTSMEPPQVVRGDA